MLERDNLFAVGDEFQSIYGFRHADVTIFRERARRAGRGRRAAAAANFRSRGELLDVLNGAFAPSWASGFAPLLAGNGATGRRAAPVRPGRAGAPEPRVELLVTDPAGGRTTTGSGRRAPRRQPARRAEARAARRSGCARRSTPAAAPGEIVVLVRAAASLRLLEQALEEQRRADLRRRRPRLLVAAAGPRRHRLPRRARQPARRGGALGVLASPFSASPRTGSSCSRPRRARARRRCGPRCATARLGAAAGCAGRRRGGSREFARASRPSARTPSGSPRGAARAGARGARATTSRVLARAGGGAGWRTCAS